jgi:hypothetical protein
VSRVRWIWGARVRCRSCGSGLVWGRGRDPLATPLAFQNALTLPSQGNHATGDQVVVVANPLSCAARWS